MRLFFGNALVLDLEIEVSLAEDVGEGGGRLREPRRILPSVRLSATSPFRQAESPISPCECSARNFLLMRGL